MKCSFAEVESTNRLNELELRMLNMLLCTRASQIIRNPSIEYTIIDNKLTFVNRQYSDDGRFKLPKNADFLIELDDRSVFIEVTGLDMSDFALRRKTICNGLSPIVEFNSTIHSPIISSLERKMEQCRCLDRIFRELSLPFMLFDQQCSKTLSKKNIPNLTELILESFQ